MACGYTRSNNRATQATSYYRKYRLWRYKKCASVTHKQIQPISGVNLSTFDVKWEKHALSNTEIENVLIAATDVHQARALDRTLAGQFSPPLLISLLGYCHLVRNIHWKICEGNGENHNNHREERRRKNTLPIYNGWAGREEEWENIYIYTPCVIDDILRHRAIPFKVSVFLSRFLTIHFSFIHLFITD